MHSDAWDNRRSLEVSLRTCLKAISLRETVLVKPHFARICCFYFHHKESANIHAFQSILMITSHPLENISILLFFFFYRLCTSSVCFSSFSSRLFVSLFFLWELSILCCKRDRECVAFCYFV